MKLHLNQKYGNYGQRRQVETVYSMIKRRLTTHVAARSHWGRCRELMLLIVTHNAMILLWTARFSTEHSRLLLAAPMVGVDFTILLSLILDLPILRFPLQV